MKLECCLQLAVQYEQDDYEIVLENMNNYVQMTFIVFQNFGLTVVKVICKIFYFTENYKRYVENRVI